MPPKKKPATPGKNQPLITNFFRNHNPRENRIPSSQSSNASNSSASSTPCLPPVQIPKPKKKQRAEKRQKYRNPREGTILVDLTNDDDSVDRVTNVPCSTALTPSISNLVLSSGSQDEPVASSSYQISPLNGNGINGTFLTPLLTPSVSIRNLDNACDETQKIEVKTEFDIPSDRTGEFDATPPLSPYLAIINNIPDFTEEEDFSDHEFENNSLSLLGNDQPKDLTSPSISVINLNDIIEPFSDCSQNSTMSMEQETPVKERLEDPETDFEDDDANTTSNANFNTQSIDFVEINKTTSKFNEALLAAETTSQKTPNSKTSSNPRRLLEFSPLKSTKSPKSRTTRFDGVRNLNKKSPKGSRTPSASTSNAISPRRLNMNVGESPQKTVVTGPYYLENFLAILKMVAENEANVYLFNEAEMELINQFTNILSYKSKCLFMRLFQRQWKWRSPAKIKYEAIAIDLMPFFDELLNHKFLEILTNENGENEDLEATLKLLTAEQLFELAKKMGVGNRKKTMELKIDLLLKMARTQKTLTKQSSTNKILKAALEILGSMYRIGEFAKNFFNRILLIYSPSQYSEGDTKTTNDTLTMLLANQGIMNFPTFNIIREKRLFFDRNSLIRFQESLTSLINQRGLLEKKDWPSAQFVTNEAMAIFEEILNNDEIKNIDLAAPSFLRIYTAGSVLARMIWEGVDAFQKTKDFKRANELVDKLLSQDCYLSQYRGRWFERFFVNLTHLKVPSNIIMDKMKDVLCNDQTLNDSYKYSLSQRYLKLKTKAMKKNKVKRGRKRKRIDEDSENEEVELDIPILEDAEPFIFQLKKVFIENHIEGEMMERVAQFGKSVFVSESPGADNSLSFVEDFAFRHYKEKGFSHYVHGEGAVPVTLFGLVFWDIIYKDVPDAFFNSTDHHPQDLHFEDFYLNRKMECDKMIHNLRVKWSLNDLLSHIETKWNENFEKLCIINWKVFKSLEKFTSFVKTLQLRDIAAICGRLMKNFRHARGGFPDLTIWNANECKFVEVKGPNDKISSKQFIWIDFLMSVGINAEVCHVKSVSNKRIRTKRNS